MLFDYGKIGRKVSSKQSSNSRTTLAAKISLFSLMSIAGDNSIASQPAKYLVRNILHKLINEWKSSPPGSGVTVPGKSWVQNSLNLGLNK